MMHAARQARVVGAGAEGGVVDLVDALAHERAIGVLGLERVIHHQDIGAFAGDGAVEAEGQAVTGVVVFVTALGVLVAGQLEDVARRRRGTRRFAGCGGS